MENPSTRIQRMSIEEYMNRPSHNGTVGEQLQNKVQKALDGVNGEIQDVVYSPQKYPGGTNYKFVVWGTKEGRDSLQILSVLQHHAWQGREMIARTIRQNGIEILNENGSSY